MSATQAPAAVDYARFVEQSRRISSIDLRAYKPAQMERRLRSLLARRGIAGFDTYARILQKDREALLEFEHYVTINVTQFYRDPRHFLALEQALREHPQTHVGPFKAWSAGCSNGSEPYTLAMLLATIAPGRRHRIDATDIDEQSLHQARLGCGYSAADIATLPDRYKLEFVQREAGGATFAIVPAIRSMVGFYRHDLVSDQYRQEYDIIVCRNVVIYLSNESKQQTFDGFYRSLNPGGILFIGPSEMLTSLREMGFVQLGHGLYQRPAGN